MKFYNYINEYGVEDDLKKKDSSYLDQINLEKNTKFKDDEKFISILTDNLKLVKKDYLKMLYENNISPSSGYIYRGSPNSFNVIGRFKTHTQRIPIDTPIFVRDAVDNVFKEKFGWRLRTEGAFVTTKYMVSGAWGLPCIFFPIGDYKLVWMKNDIGFYGLLDDEINDVFNEFDYNIHSFIDSSLQTEENKRKIEDITRKILKENKFVDGHIEQFLKTSKRSPYSGVEGVCKCREHLLLFMGGHPYRFPTGIIKERYDLLHKVIGDII